MGQLFALMLKVIPYCHFFYACSLTELMNLMVTDIDDMKITVIWTHHNNSNCIPGLQYYVEIFDDEDFLKSNMTADNSYTFSGLTGNTTYTIVVQTTVGNNAGGNISIDVTTNPSGLFATFDI